MARPVSSADILNLRVQQRPHGDYVRAMRYFELWLNPDATPSENFIFLNLPPDDLDSLLVKYFTFLFNQPKFHFHRAKQTFSAFLFFNPKLRFSLSNSHAMIKAFTKKMSVPTKAPIPWHVACIFARICCELCMPKEALAFLLMHHTYLRVNNILKLKKSDVVANLQDVDPSFPLMILRVYQTKTDPFKFVTIRRKDLADILVSFCDFLKNDDDLIFDFSYSHLRNVLKMLCKKLGLQHYGFTIHKFRHGGASHDYLKGVDFQTIKIRGILKQDSSADRYISSGVCFSILTSLPKEYLTVGKILDEALTK